MILLNSSTSLQVLLSVAPVTNQCPLFATYADLATDTSQFLPAPVDGLTNGVTAVDWVAAAPAGFTRQIKYLSLFNADTASVVVIVRINNGVNTRILAKVTLPVSSRLEFDGAGFRVLSADGAIAGGGGGGGSGQPLDATLTALAGLASSPDALPYFTDTDALATTTLTAYMRTLLDDANATDALATLGALSAALVGAANGVAPLGADSKISTAYLPAAVLGSLAYQGTWNANTNSPAIPTAVSGNKGQYYKVATAGATSIDGITDWKVGDWIVSNGGTWDKIDNTDSVTSVAGLAGGVTASALKAALALVKADVGLSNVDDTSDANKPVSTPQQTALNLKRPLVPRVQALTNAGTVTADADANDAVSISAQNAALVIANPTGTLNDEQKLIYRIKDNGSARALSFGTIFRPGVTALPTTTVAGKWLRLGFIYNATDSKLDLVAVSQEA